MRVSFNTEVSLDLYYAYTGSASVEVAGDSVAWRGEVSDDDYTVSETIEVEDIVSINTAEVAELVNDHSIDMVELCRLVEYAPEVEPEISTVNDVIQLAAEAGFTPSALLRGIADVLDLNVTSRAIPGTIDPSVINPTSN